MAIRVRCPRCWETAEVPEEALGKSGKCNRCGARVQIPAKLSKACFLCGIDVTHVRHAKDEDGNYLCMDCFGERAPSQRALFAVPDVECSECHAKFAEGEGFERDGDPVCKDCFERGVRVESIGARVFEGDDHHLDLRPPSSPVLGEREMERAERAAITAPMPPPPPKKEEDGEPHAHKWESLADIADREFSKPGDQKVSEALAEAAAGPAAARRGPVVVRSGGKWGPMLALMALTGVGYLAWQQHRMRPTWESENGAIVRVLKSQGDFLQQLNRPEEALAKYNELLAMAGSRPIRDSVLKQVVADAQWQKQAIEQGGRDDWEDRHAMRLLILKAQAEVLAAVGKHDESLAKYAELQALVKGRALSNPVLIAEMRKVAGEMQMVRQDKLAAGQPRAPQPVVPEAIGGTQPVPGPTTLPVKVTPEAPVAVSPPPPVRGVEPVTQPPVTIVPRPPERPVVLDHGPTPPAPTTRKSIFDD